ncbi:MAG TPA: thioredoxin [Acidimicrobiales bacterium]|nr:thioredoxin [Acidimicrobiales bacterium]
MTTMTATVVVCPSCSRKNRVPAAAPGLPRCAHCHNPLPWVADATDDTFAEVAEAPTIPVIVDLWAPWCEPCRMVSPALESLAREYAGRIKLVKVNVDLSPELSRRFRVQGIPALLVLDGGRVVAEQVGAAPERALRAWLDQALAALA